jgi:tricorn protease
VHRATRGWGIWVMNANGSHPRKLVGMAWTPAWSPDGTKVAFVRSVRGNTDIYVIGVNGKGLRRLTYNPGPDDSPDWAALP